MTSIIWEYNNVVISDPINLGSFEELDVSSEYEIIIRHDSNSSITNCNFYVSPYSGEYSGTHSAQKDYERLLWYGNNYPGYGISLIQRYTVTGTIDDHNGIKVADYERTEQKDIFAGQEIEILSGNALGEKAIIDYYDPIDQIFILAETFSTGVSGSNYRISITDETFFKTKQGSSYSYPIDMISNAGEIPRLESASISLKIKVPKYAISAGRHLFDLNMNFTSTEE